MDNHDQAPIPDYQSILNKYAQSVTDQSPSPSTPILESGFESQLTSNINQVPSPPRLDFFKVLFYFSLICFFVVCAYAAYSFFRNPNSRSLIQAPIPTPTIVSSPTPVACLLNDKQYPVNTSFPAADGCNTCTCSPDLQFICTQMVCTTTPPASTESAIPADWKTYTNSTYRYQLSIPSDWLNLTGPSEENSILNFRQGGYEIGLTIDSTSSSTIQDYLKQSDKKAQVAWEGTPSIKVISTKLTKIGNYSVVQREEQWLAASFLKPVVNTYFLNNGRVYSIVLKHVGDDSNSVQGVNTYRQVLSSFRFIDSSASAIPADWKTYSDARYHFSFQYPPTLIPESKIQNPKDSLHLYLTNTNGQEVARLHVYPDEVENKKPEFFQSEQTINSILWQVVLYPSGLDSGDMKLTAPILYYISNQNDTKYSWQFNGVSQLTDLQAQILSTFKFLP